MSSRQHFPRLHESPQDGHRGFDAERRETASKAKFAKFDLAQFQLPAHTAEQLGALAILGLARSFEWQAAAFHVVLNEWTRQQHEWLSSVVEMEYALKHFGLSRSHLERVLDVARLWGAWTVTTQLAAAQGLVSSCSPQRIGLPADSGRRAGFDLGRRASAVVIGFPDRRRSGERR